MFANLGDGTYFHSGLLAIRQARRRVNITYKILYNDAVAMTGGQQVGERPRATVVQIAQSMRAEGVQAIVVVTDEPAKYDDRALAEGVTSCTTAMSWSASSWRFAKHLAPRSSSTTRPAPPKSAAVASAAPWWTRPGAWSSTNWCARAAATAACSPTVISVEPLETEFGRKRTINQSTCNKDFLRQGFCPSFVTVEGGKLRKQGKGKAAAAPSWQSCPADPAYAGVGLGHHRRRCRRHGVITIGSCWAWPHTWKARAS